jgi:hypothetical protein
MSDDESFEAAFEEVVENDSKLLNSEPVAFIHAVVGDLGGVGTISATRHGEITYEERVSMLAALIAEVEAESDRSAEQLFHDLVEERNAMRDSGGDER